MAHSEDVITLGCKTGQGSGPKVSSSKSVGGNPGVSKGLERFREQHCGPSGRNGPHHPSLLLLEAPPSLQAQTQADLAQTDAEPPDPMGFSQELGLSAVEQIMRVDAEDIAGDGTLVAGPERPNC